MSPSSAWLTHLHKSRRAEPGRVNARLEDLHSISTAQRYTLESLGAYGSGLRKTTLEHLRNMELAGGVIGEVASWKDNGISGRPGISQIFVGIK